jgi:hypothetical protein
MKLQDIKEFDYSLTIPLMDTINVYLQDKCSMFDLQLDTLPLDEKEMLFILNLYRNGESVSSIELEFDCEGNNGLFIHSFTDPKEEGKKYNSFLRSVVILIAYNLRYSTLQGTDKKFKFIGSNTANWISDWLLLSKFGFWVSQGYQSQDYLKFKDLREQEYPKLKQQFKQTYFKKPQQCRGLCYKLDLNPLLYDKYLKLCYKMLTNIIC